MLLLDSIIQLSWPGILFQVVAIIFFIIGLFLLNYVRKNIARGISCEGKIVDYYQKPTSRSNTYTPVFEFKTRNGELVRGRHYMGFSIQYKQIGAVLPIYYYPGKMNLGYEVIINKFFWTYALPIYIFIVSAICFFLPVIFDFP